MLTLTDPASVLKSLALLPRTRRPRGRTLRSAGRRIIKQAAAKRALSERFAATLAASQRSIPVFQTRPHMLVCAVHTGDLATLRDLVFPTLNVTIKTRADFETHATCVRSRGALRAAPAVGA